MKHTSHTQTPDTSNLIKFVEDSLNGVIWLDDSLIYHIIADKTWSDISKTILKVFI